MSKPEIFKVTVTVEKPSSTNPAGQVSFRLLHRDTRRPHHDGWRRCPHAQRQRRPLHPLRRGREPALMACVLTKQVRAGLHGYSALWGEKREPIQYPPTGWR